VKKLLLSAVCALAATIFFSTSVLAVDIFFEHRSTQQITRGVVYEQNRMMTSRGMLDVHVLLIDLDEPHITVAPVASGRMGMRDTTSSLLSGAGAVAGINADFFGMASNHSIHFGPMARNGRLLSANATTNVDNSGFATFFLDMNNNPFFRYIQTSIRFYNNGERNVTVGTLNTIGPALWMAAVVDRNGMFCTTALDARIPNLVKIVVENNVITRITEPGETVIVPSNGYLVILPPSMNDSTYRFSAGDSAALRIGNNMSINYSGIRAAIGGGGLILSRGEMVTGGVAPGGRHPRSAVGVTRDGRLILMAVDGRSHSIGVTHAEMAALMIHYNTYDAMHFDGGGSTTMVTRAPGGAYTVANTPSDGSQRRVINALGVFDNAPRGEMARLVLEMAENRAVVGVPLPAVIFGEDTSWNRINVDTSANAEVQPVFTADPSAGFWENGRYTALRAGEHVIGVRIGNFSTTTTINAYFLAELRIHPDSLVLIEGQHAHLSFSGVAVDDTQVSIPEVTGLSVSPASLGRFENGSFIAMREGSGYISAVVGAIRQYIPVSVGGFPREMNLLASEIGFMAHPTENVRGSVSIENVGNQRFPRLDYEFDTADRTLAAYLTFDPPLAVPGNPMAIRMQVLGDGSGHWLRGRVRDSSGSFHNIDFIRSADFVDWQTVTALLPPGAPPPFTLDRIYMVTLESHMESRHMVLFRDLAALFAPTEQARVPQGTVMSDRLRVERHFGGIPGGRNYTFNIPTASSQTEYDAFGWADFAVVTMTAEGGGLAAGGITQWRDFMPDIRSNDPSFVLVLMDSNPLHFRQRMEFELFHLAMRELQNEGRLVFVVSSQGDETNLHIRDGVRYIDMAMPEEGTASIRFWTDGDRIWWSD